jgi:quercetin dioxygenase-like cupin family protein
MNPRWHRPLTATVVLLVLAAVWLLRIDEAALEQVDAGWKRALATFAAARALAREHGLVLLETGQLIDTVAGQAVPEGARPMPATTPEQVAALKRVSTDEATGFVWRNDERPGTYATAIIGEAGPLDWDHGFAVDRLDIKRGETLEVAPVGAAEVVFVHRGRLNLHWSGGTIGLGAGDTISVPPGLARSFKTDEGCIAYLVRR